MSSNTWTPEELSSEFRALAGRCWRAVEARHYVSTLKLTDTHEEQSRLEELIEATKPRIPEECRHLPYLLSTPFRYGAPYPTGSRFRRAGLTAGVFYAAEFSRTAIAELTFYRLLFFAESPARPGQPIPANTLLFRPTLLRSEQLISRETLSTSRERFGLIRRTTVPARIWQMSRERPALSQSDIVPPGQVRKAAIWHYSHAAHSPKATSSIARLGGFT
jgi:hypothetical protein